MRLTKRASCCLFMLTPKAFFSCPPTPLFHSTPTGRKYFEPPLSHLYRQYQTHDNRMLATTRNFLKAQLFTNPIRALPFFTQHRATTSHAGLIKRSTLRSCQNAIQFHQLRRITSSNHSAKPDDHTVSTHRTGLVERLSARNPSKRTPDAAGVIDDAADKLERALSRRCWLPNLGLCHLSMHIS